MSDPSVSLDTWLAREAGFLLDEADRCWRWQSRKRRLYQDLAKEYRDRAEEARLMREKLVRQENPSWKDMAL